MEITQQAVSNTVAELIGLGLFRQHLERIAGPSEFAFPAKGANASNSPDAQGSDWQNVLRQPYERGVTNKGSGWFAARN
jgi:hypothetical protein